MLTQVGEVLITQEGKISVGHFVTEKGTNILIHKYTRVLQNPITAKDAIEVCNLSMELLRLNKFDLDKIRIYLVGDLLEIYVADFKVNISDLPAVGNIPFMKRARNTGIYILVQNLNPMVRMVTEIFGKLFTKAFAVANLDKALEAIEEAEEKARQKAGEKP